MPVPQIKKPAPAQIDSTEETENAASSETKDSTQNSTTKKTENNSETKSTQKNTTQTTSATSSLENTSAVNTSETSTQTSSKAETEQNSSTKSSTTQNESSSEYNSQTLLQEANILYNKKEFEAAKKKLDQYFLNPDSEIDRAYFLLGQVLESKSSIQNIKAALNAYTNVTKNYPASNYWEDANKRIIYLKRFYLEAR